MATVEKNRGYLVVSFYWQGKRQRRGFRERDTRENRRTRGKWLVQFEAALKRPDFDLDKWFPGQRSSKHPATESLLPLTLGAYARRWLGLQELTEASKRDYEYLFRKFLDRTPLGAMEVARVTRADIALATRGGSPRRVTMLLQRLRSIFQLAIDEELREKNPASLVRNPKRPAREPVEAFSEVEQTALLALATGRNRWLIAILLGSGVRPGEALRIERKDIDPKRRRLYVRGTKTAAAARHVDPESIAMTALEEIFHANIIGPVFGRLNFPNWRDRVWKPLLKEAQIAHRHPYKLRHTYALNRLEEGRTPLWISRQLGHTSTQMIHRVYGRFAPQTQNLTASL